MNTKDILYFKYDLPDDLILKGDLAVDTETLGLNIKRDRLCVVQIADEDGKCVLVHFPTADYDRAVNLKKLLSSKRQMLFHYARFDISTIKHYLGVDVLDIFCTKIASFLTRTYTSYHGLKDICRELLGASISKEQQCSDWAVSDLSDAQKIYAASDVIYLHALRDKFIGRLHRENRFDIFKKSCDFLPCISELDLSGWEEKNIFAHKING